jgi:hypothetical protein
MTFFIIKTHGPGFYKEHKRMNDFYRVYLLSDKGVFSLGIMRISYLEEYNICPYI